MRMKAHAPGRLPTQGSLLTLRHLKRNGNNDPIKFLVEFIPFCYGKAGMFKQVVPSLSAHGRLRFRHLQLLDILGRTRNLRLAAEQMHITQPAATKILADIEEIFGATLFERLPREMRPTELGVRALRYSAETLAVHNKFFEEFETLKGGGHGHLTVGTISGFAAHPLTTSIKEIKKRRPLLVIKVLEQSSDQLLAWLAERKIDVMIGRFTENWQRADFQYERLLEEELWVVACHHHPLCDNKHFSMVDLANWPWILYPQPTALRKVTDDIFRAAGFTSTLSVVETASFLSAFELLQSTEMISLQPATIVQKYVDKGLLTRLHLDVPTRMPDYGIITRSGESPPSPVQDFMEVVRLVTQKELP
jgi:DNA-binding transcriptional LysR family regulator